MLALCPDALVPFEYVQQLESVSGGAAHPGGNIYAAPVLFEQDASAVPGIVRATGAVLLHVFSRSSRPAHAPCTRSMAREMMWRWISLVPSQMRSTRASRQ